VHDSLNNLVKWAYKEKVDYSTGLYLQRKLHERVSSNSSRSIGFLLLVEHEPVITIGRFGKANSILISPEDMKKLGIEIYRTERGGDVTFHGPGQIVGYPIINLRDFKLGIKSYVHLLEETIIRALQDFGIEGRRIKEYPGVWVGREKIAAIGVYVKNWITMHGFALNVTPDLSYFSLIVPCGISDMGVTSMKKLLDKEISLGQVVSALVEQFGRIFQANMRRCDSLV
jgi:lipoate-protein ligase B